MTSHLKNIAHPSEDAVEAIEQLILSGNYPAAEVAVTELLNWGQDGIPRGQALALYVRILRGQGRQDSDLYRSVESELMGIAIQTNDLRLLALAHFRMGDRHFCEGRLNEAKDYWEKSLNFFTKANEFSSYDVAYLHFHMGILYRDLFIFSTAVENLSKAFDLSRELEISYLNRKCLTELFFCHFYQGQLDLCRIIYEQIQWISRGYLTEIENLILRAYLNIGQSKYISAKRNFLHAQALIRRHKLSKNRYDMYFHLAYLYSKKGEFSKARLFIGKKCDPIYQLFLKQIEAESTTDFTIIDEYSELALKSGIEFHQERARHLNYNLSKFKSTIEISFSRQIAILKNKRISFKGKRIIGRAIECLLIQKQFSKSDLLKTVFEFASYDPIIHDGKVYKLVSEINHFFGRSILIAEKGYYILNPNFILIDLDQKSVSAKYSIREMAKNMSLSKDELSPRVSLLFSQKQFKFKYLSKK